jgi:CheY-like chemotaxis protein
MPTGGCLRLTTHSEPAAGWVRLVVEDTGMGMDEATALRVFEPFFTTKEVGKGTGLGLATVYGIVEQCGGSVTVASRPGESTRFDVLLPIAEATEDVVVTAVPRGSDGTERILLVEDEPGVRGVVTKMLTAHGYVVVAADGPLEALDLLERGAFEPDLVISDLVMPKLSGVAFAERVEARRPGTRFLFISGFSGHALLEGSGSLQGAELMQKPFTAGELTKAARRVLDTAGAERLVGVDA